MSESPRVFSQQTSIEVPSEIGPDDPRRELSTRAEEWGFDPAWRRYVSSSPDEEDHPWTLEVAILAGKSRSHRRITRERAQVVLDAGPIQVRALEGINALIFGHGEVEVALRSLGPNTLYSFRRLPWVERIPSESTEGDAGNTDEEPLAEEAARGDEQWQLQVLHTPPGINLSFGPPSRRFLGFNLSPLRSPVTLRIRGIGAQRHDETRAFIEDTVGDLGFEFDLKYGLAFGIQAVPTEPRLPRALGRRSRDVPPTFPSQHYASEPLSLYWYGRSASNMPLLRYLAFYQVLEFHFPQFFHRELIERLRKELKDPRFRAGDDAQITKLLALARSGPGNRGTEVEQLSATIRACLTTQALREFLDGELRVRQSLTGKRILEGVAQLNLEDKSHDLRDQVARRVYAIRCRIVHTKDDEATYGSKMLLPFSAEAERLFADVSLVQFLAQKVLISSSRDR